MVCCSYISAAGDANGAWLDAPEPLKLWHKHTVLLSAGGEWMSSIDIENAALSHPGVMEAAAVAMPHKKWGERPLLVVVPRQPPGALLATVRCLACTNASSEQAPAAGCHAAPAAGARCFPRCALVALLPCIHMPLDEQLRDSGRAVPLSRCASFFPHWPPCSLPE